MREYGEVVEPGAVRLERLLPGPIERIWAFLTDSELRAKWLAGGPMDLRIHGQVELRFQHHDLSHEKTPAAKYADIAQCHKVLGQITVFAPPHRLSYTWGGFPNGDSEVSFELTPVGDQVRLVIVHRRLGDLDTMCCVAAGWHSHVGLMEDHLHGLPPRGFWSNHTELEAEYRRRFLPKTKAETSAEAPAETSNSRGESAETSSTESRA